jgi:pyrroline-5-carboxylate reductase
MTAGVDGPLLLVGAGKMGAALLTGWLARGIDRRLLTIQDPGPPPESVELLAAHQLDAVAAAEPEGSLAAIILAVKPQIMDTVLPPLRRHAGPQTLLLSIAAGRTIESLARHFDDGQPVVRAMPNTPASIGRGITVACANEAVTERQRALCTSLLGAVGEVLWAEDEHLLDPVTAVSGSGPAYVFLMAECLAEAGLEAGLTPELASRLARATVSGAGELLDRSGLEPAELRENVTSPGGTTAAALEVLMARDGLQQLLTRAVEAATRRSRELSL